MIDMPALKEYVHSPLFLEKLGLPGGTELVFSLLGQGEYNVNYGFLHPGTGKRLVLRVNTGSQMHLEDQIGYEFSALCKLQNSGRTPKPLFSDPARNILVMEWLPGRPLRYETDLPAAAGILADIHSVSVGEDTRLIRPEYPAWSIYEECLSMAEHYLKWTDADISSCRLIETLLHEIGGLSLKTPVKGPRCIVNTELNSGNFLINEGERSYLIDWEKPLLSEPAQDIAHFLVPTTTFWKTDVILSAGEIAAFLRHYRVAVAGRLDLSALEEHLPLYFNVTCLRGISWCAMAMREYSEPGRVIVNEDTFGKIKKYLETDFLENILKNYVRRNFLKGGGAV